jgi:UDP-glucose 4-epimerase
MTSAVLTHSSRDPEKLTGPRSTPRAFSMAPGSSTDTDRYRVALAKESNLGQDRLVTINELVDMVAKIAGKRIRKRYDTTKPEGVRGRNADLTLMKRLLEWEPRSPLEEGLAAATYR